MADYRWLNGIIILMALILVIPGVSAEDGSTADLNIAKALSANGHWAVNTPVSWTVTVSNAGPSSATNVVVTEDISQLTDHGDIDVDVSDGIYDSDTGTWNIDGLAVGESATLTLATSFLTPGEKTNSVTVSADEEDENESDNSATSSVVIYDRVITADLKIRPTTLNINSNGIFTVFITLSGDSTKGDDGAAKPQIDYEKSSVTCSGSQLVRASVSNKDGGTMVAKFYRADLREVTAGNGVLVTCSGTLSVDGKSVFVEGSDTIRVIGEKKGLDKLFSDVKKFFGLEKDETEIDETEDVNETAPVTLAPESYKNKGQEKKLNQDPAGGITESPTTEAIAETANGKGNAGKSNGKGNSGNEDNDNGNQGKGSGKGNANTQGSDDKPQKNSNGNGKKDR